MNSVAKALTLSSPNPVRGGSVCLPDNGSNTKNSAALTGAAAMTQIVNHNGEPIWNQRSRDMIEEVIDVAFSYTKLIPSILLTVASNIRVAIRSRNE